MNKKLWSPRVVCCVVLAVGLCLPCVSGFAAEGPVGKAQGGKPFHVASAALHVEGVHAELCLYFSDTIDHEDRSRYLPVIDLRKDGKKEKLTAKDISLTPNTLCVQNLEHRAHYDFLFSKIKSAEGERLSKAYETVFTVPDRKAALAFIADSNLSILPRHVQTKAGVQPIAAGMAHVLRSVNVAQTHLTLYRIPDRAAWVGAWQQFTMLNLSPLESLVFARGKGQAVFESDLVFSQDPNIEQTLVVPLPSDEALAPGLYYLAATPKEQEQKQAKPGLFAGQWFLVSDLRLTAVRLPEGVRVFAGHLATHNPVAAIDVQVLARNGDVLAQAQTDADGMVLLNVSEKNKDKIALVTGGEASGDLDILDIDREPTLGARALKFTAFVRPDREAYQPGSTAMVMLRAEDGAGQALDIKSSVLKLLRPDRRTYSHKPLPTHQTGLTVMSLPLPFAGQADTWTLSWQREDGSVIAEAPLTLRPGLGEAKLELRVPREDAGESVHLSLKASDAYGQALAFQPGKLTVRGTAPEVKGWDAYDFGVAPAPDAPPLRQVDFMTGADGRVNVTLPQERGGLWDALALEASLEGEGALADVTIPVRRFSSLIGIRPLKEGRSFAENGVAQFDVIAVDANGKRRAENDLYYLVYEEGRSFEWFTSEGHWDYKPLPQHRRVGGGALSLSASGETLVRWPVTTGQYVLEITNASGALLARHAFEAGRVAPNPEPQDGVQRLSFTDPAMKLDEGKTNKLALNLAAPAFVSAVAFDGKTRATIFRFMPAGHGELSLTPNEEWQDKVLVHVQAVFLDTLAPASVEETFKINQSHRELTLKVSAPQSLIAGTSTLIPVKISKVHGKKPTFLDVIATPLSKTGYTTFPVQTFEPLTFDAEGRAKVKLTLPSFDGAVRLTFVAWNEAAQYGETTLTLPAKPALALAGAAPGQLAVGDKAEMPLTLTNNAAPSGAYSYALILPAGISVAEPLKGKLTLGQGASVSLPLTLTARGAGDGVLSFTLTGPDGTQRLAAQWPVTVSGQRAGAWDLSTHLLESEKAEAFAALTTADSSGKAVRLWSPLPLPDVQSALQKMVASAPYTTKEIALWLENERQWGEPLKAFGLISGPRLEALRVRYVRELQLRQNEDGGFPLVSVGAPSDMVSTAAALLALRDQAEQPVALAVAWLQGKLQNTWFEESERAARIEALESLARAGHADLAALRYFSETSKDKDLSPQTSAFLGLALVEGGDTETARNWTQRAQNALPVLAKDNAVAFWRVARLLALNQSVSPEALKAVFAQEPADFDGQSPVEVMSALHALAQAAVRSGTWTLFIDEQKVKGLGLSVMRKDPAGEPHHILAKQPLYLVTFTPQTDILVAKDPEKDEPPSSVQRTFFKRDGSAFDFDLSLMMNEAYVLVLQGEVKAEEADGLRLILPETAAFTFLPPEEPSVMRQQFPWLPEGLTSIDQAASMPGGFVFTLKPQSTTFRVALLVKPQRKGAFALPSCRLLTATGERLPLTQNAIAFSVW